MHGTNTDGSESDVSDGGLGSPQSARNGHGGESGGDGLSLQQQAANEAQIKLANADGDSQEERIQNAFEESLRQLKSIDQQQQSSQERYDTARSRIENLGRTLRKLREVRDGNTDASVTREYPGGIYISVPHSELGEHITEIHDEIGSLREDIVNAEQREATLADKRELVRATLEQFEQLAAETSTQPNPSANGGRR